MFDNSQRSSNTKLTDQQRAQVYEMIQLTPKHRDLLSNLIILKHEDSKCDASVSSGPDFHEVLVDAMTRVLVDLNYRDAWTKHFLQYYPKSSAVSRVPEPVSKKIVEEGPRAVSVESLVNVALSPFDTEFIHDLISNDLPEVWVDAVEFAMQASARERGVSIKTNSELFDGLIAELNVQNDLIGDLETPDSYEEMDYQFALDSLLSELSDLDRKIFECRLSHEVAPWHEIADLCGLNVQTVKTRFEKIEANIKKKYAMSLEPGILVIEDSSDDRERLYQLLQQFTSNIQVARCLTSAFEAIKSFQMKRQFDLIIVDLCLEKAKDGLNLMRYARNELGCKSPFLVVSGHWGTVVKDSDVSALLPCIGFRKPFTDSLLENTVKRFIENASTAGKEEAPSLGGKLPGTPKTTQEVVDASAKWSEEDPKQPYFQKSGSLSLSANFQTNFGGSVEARAEIIKRTALGDTEAMGLLFSHITFSLPGRFLSHLRMSFRVDPNDIISEAFVRLLQNVDKLDANRDPLPYFKAICRRLACDSLEKESNEFEVLRDDALGKRLFGFPDHVRCPAENKEHELNSIEAEFSNYCSEDLSEMEFRIVQFRAANPDASWKELEQEFGKTVNFRDSFFKLKRKLRMKFSELNPDPGVLVVEDSAVDRQQMTQAALASTSNVQTARTIDGALEKLEIFQRSRKFGAILVDLCFSKQTDGLDFIKQARLDLGCLSPIFVVSSHWGSTVKDKDVRDFQPCIGFRKPTPDAVIQNVVANAIQLPS